ncbi:MAG: four-carbon acid sugar kinase family protein [Planctomycetota bacterium]|jgi:uncharacterized protein YgbK (DUF1537 family)
MPVQLQGILDSLPPIWPEELLPAIRREHEKRSLSIVVLDDDPTGTQTVYDVPVLTNWKLDTIIDEFERQTPLFYVLTNSRSLPTADAVDLALEAGTNILNASQQTGRAFEIISRSDSTLRGHFPAEVDALAEGGRYTIDDIHYVKEEQHLIEAAKTAFAKDIVFGYRNSDLKKWVEEKTRDRIAAESVLSLSLADIREGGADRIADKLAECGPGSVCVVNAVDYRDMEVATLGLLQARQKGQRFLFRTAASFVRVRAGLGGRPLLTADEMVDPGDTGGLVIVGSHVPRYAVKKFEDPLSVQPAPWLRDWMLWSIPLANLSSEGTMRVHYLSDSKFHGRL